MGNSHSPASAVMSTEEPSHHLVSNNVDELQTLSTTTTSQEQHDLQPDTEELYWPAPQSLSMTGVRQWAKSRGFISSEGWSLDKLLASGELFYPVPRVSASSQDLVTAINEHEQSGVPLIIDEWHMHPKWPRDLFTIEKFRADSPDDISVRNVRDWSDKKLPLSVLIEKLRAIPPFAAPDEAERLYGKDAPCPPEWNAWLRDSGVLPSSLLPEGTNNMLLNVPESERVETLMCYLGIGDTFTPCHKDLCASSGQNIMCYTERSGSSFWFMTASSDAAAAAKYLQVLKQELDHETYVIKVEELARAPFKVYVAEQKLGDMVLVPPRSCHQVVNYGGITIKTSWSRMTISGLSAAIYHELPIYRRVCRPETYRIKYTVYHTLISYIKKFERFASLNRLGGTGNHSSATATTEFSSSTTYIPVSSSRDEPRAATDSDGACKYALAQDFWRLVKVFDDIIVEEYCKDHHGMPCLHPSPSEESADSFVDGGDRITCDFCGSDIFQSFFECWDCAGASGSDAKKAELGDGLVICPSCYVEGRSCRCELMTPVQYRPCEDLLNLRRRATDLVSSLREERTLSQDHALIDEKQLLSEERLGLFNAGYVFQQTRKQNLATRSCRIKESSSHHVPFISALPCKKCHSFKCFWHLLTCQGIHSAEAILGQRKDDQHEYWHRRHSRVEIDRAKAEALQAEKDGAHPELRHQLVKIASAFPICNPLKPQFVKLGWYDKIIPACKVEAQPLVSLLDESPLPSLTPSPLLSGGFLPDEDNRAAQEIQSTELSMTDDRRVTQMLVPQYSMTPPTSVSCGGSKTPERTYVSQTSTRRHMPDKLFIPDSTSRNDRQRVTLDYVLMPSTSLNRKLHSPGAQRDHQKTTFNPARLPGKRSNDTVIERSMHTPKMGLPPGAKVGPPVKWSRSVSRKRRLSDVGTVDERPRPTVRTKVESRAYEESAILTTSAAGSSKSRTGLGFHQSTRRPMAIGGETEWTRPGSMAQAMNRAYQDNSRVTRDANIPVPGPAVSSDYPPTPKVSTMKKVYEKKLQVLEKRFVEDGNKLREELEAQMKIDRQDLMQQIKALTSTHEEELDKLQKIILEKDTQLRLAEMNRPKPNQVVLPESLLRQIIDSPMRNNRLPFPVPRHGWGRGRGGSVARGSPTLRQNVNQRGQNRNSFPGSQATGVSGHASNNNQLSGMRRFASLPEGSGNHAPRFPSHRGSMRRDRGYGLPNRGHLGSRPRYPNQQNQTRGNRYRSTARSESRMASQPTSPRQTEGYHRDKYSITPSPSRAISSDDMVAESSSASEPVHMNDRGMAENMESGMHERVGTNMRASTPSEQSEYWEDRYEEVFLNHESTSTSRLDQREISGDRRATYTMEVNPWAL